MSNDVPSGAAEHGVADEPMLRVVAQKLTSQALLFSLATIALLVASAAVLKVPGLAVLLAIVLVFGVAMFGYLFLEKRRKIRQGDPGTVNPLMRSMSEGITNGASDLSVKVWVEEAEEDRAGSRHVAGAAAAAGEAAGATGRRDIAVTPAAAKPQHRIGDNVVVSFEASRDCYLTLLNIGTSGKLTILYPNALHPDNRAKGGSVYRIPAPEYGFEYRLQGPPGVEKLKAIATLERVELLESNFAPDGSPFRTVRAEQGARDIAIIKKNVAEIPAADWAEAEYDFKVV